MSRMKKKQSENLLSRITLLHRIKNNSRESMSKMAQGLFTKAYSLKIVEHFESMGLVERTRIGKQDEVVITSKGNEYLERLTSITSLIEFFDK